MTDTLRRRTLARTLPPPPPLTRSSSRSASGQPSSVAGTKPDAPAPEASRLASDAASTRTRDFAAEFQRAVKSSAFVTLSTPYRLAKWTPEAVRRDLEAGRIPDGETRYVTEGEPTTIVHVETHDGQRDVQIRQELHEEPQLFEEKHLSAGSARCLAKMHAQLNRDMRLYAGEGVAPDVARSEMRKFNDGAFLKSIEAYATALTAAATLGVVRPALGAAARQLEALSLEESRWIAQDALSKH